jgi:hypothetical protein
MKVLYARSLPVAGRKRPLTVEAVRTFLGDDLIVVSLSHNDEVRTEFYPSQVPQVAEAFRRAADVVRSAPPARVAPAELREQAARIGWRRYALLRVVYLLFPDVLFKEECPSALSRRGFCVLVQRDYFDRTYITFWFARNAFVVPRLRLRPIEAELMANHLEHAVRKLLARSQGAT